MSAAAHKPMWAQARCPALTPSRDSEVERWAAKGLEAFASHLLAVGWAAARLPGLGLLVALGPVA